MEKNPLGDIIHKTLQQFYPNTKLPITSYEIQDILNKARINKRNSTKGEISKIIKILRHHIEIAQQNTHFETQTQLSVTSELQNKSTSMKSMQ